MSFGVITHMLLIWSKVRTKGFLYDFPQTGPGKTTRYKKILNTRNQVAKLNWTLFDRK